MGIFSCERQRKVCGASAAILATMLAGCASYHARPIEPAKTEAEFRSRTLTDAGLRDFAEKHRPATVAAWPPGEWSLDSLAVVAFYYHPDLETARARLDLAEAGIVTARARPNPTVETSLRYNVDAKSMAVPWTIPFTFDIPIETAGKRGYRIARAQRLSEAARIGLAHTVWQVRSGVRGALLDHLLAGRELDVLRTEERVRAEAVHVIERRLVVGDVSRPDVDLARIELANARLAIHSAEWRVEQSRLALAAALGIPASAIEGISLAWPELDSPPPPNAFVPATVQRTALLNRLDLRRTLVEYDAAEGALRLEVAKQYPDVRVSPGYVFEEGDNKFLIGVSITLPVLDRNEGPIAEAEARRKEAGAAFLTLQAKVIAETEDALARYRSALAELADADRALVLLAQRESAVRRELEIGESDRVALVGIQLQRVVGTRARLAALRKALTALSALENAVERPLGELR
jgi:outer membrane protein TolC